MEKILPDTIGTGESGAEVSSETIGVVDVVPDFMDNRLSSMLYVKNIGCISQNINILHIKYKYKNFANVYQI